MIPAAAVYRANQWVWWRISVTGFQRDWKQARQARFERDLQQVIGLLATAMGYPPEGTP